MMSQFQHLRRSGTSLIWVYKIAPRPSLYQSLLIFLCTQNHLIYWMRTLSPKNIKYWLYRGCPNMNLLTSKLPAHNGIFPGLINTIKARKWALSLRSFHLTSVNEKNRAFSMHAPLFLLFVCLLSRLLHFDKPSAICTRRSIPVSQDRGLKHRFLWCFSHALSE